MAWSLMKRWGFCVALLWALASAMSAQTPRPRPPAPMVIAPKPPAAAQVPPDTLQKYCFECHAGKTPEADLSIENLVRQPSISTQSSDWERVAQMLESGLMPPPE